VLARRDPKYVFYRLLKLKETVISSLCVQLGETGENFGLIFARKDHFLENSSVLLLLLGNPSEIQEFSLS